MPAPLFTPKVKPSCVVTISHDPAPLVASQRRSLSVLTRAAKEQIDVVIVVDREAHLLPAVLEQAITATYRRDRLVERWSRIYGVLPSRRDADIVATDRMQPVKCAADVSDVLTAAVRDNSILALQLDVNVPANPCLPSPAHYQIVSATWLDEPASLFPQ